MHFYIFRRNSRWQQELKENQFWQKVPDEYADTLRPNNFVEITLAHTVSEILQIHRFYR